MKKGINPLAALIAAIFLITLAWAANFHPVAFVFLAIFTGGVLTHDDEEDLLYVTRELELKKAIIEDLERKLGQVSIAEETCININATQKIHYDHIMDDDFKKLLRIAAIADKRKLGLFDKAELHKILEVYDAEIENNITTK